MNVREVIALATRWVEETGSAFPGFSGAYLAGSITEMEKDGPFPPFKDVDVYVVVEDLSRIAEPQKKFAYHGILMESVCASLEEHRSPEAILSSVHAGSVARCEILSDPAGVLHDLRAKVAAEYADPKWIAARCERQKMMLAHTFSQIEYAPDPVFALGFVVLFLGDLVALASGRRPTVRRNLALSRELLEAHGRRDLHDDLLGVLGSERMDRDQVVSHLEDCVQAFDRAVEVVVTPFYTSWNLHAGTRPYLVDGAYEMIDAGDHREAMFWISMLHSIANMAIQNDAPEAEKARYQATMDRLKTALGVPDAAAWQSRIELARSVSERVTRFADDVVARAR
jgi:hypothetical protein